MLRRMFGGRGDHSAGPAASRDPIQSVTTMLASLEAGGDTFAIFDAGHGHYVQVSLGETGLYGEAVSNAYLKGADRI